MDVPNITRKDYQVNVSFGHILQYCLLCRLNNLVLKGSNCLEICLKRERNEWFVDCWRGVSHLSELKCCFSMFKKNIYRHQTGRSGFGLTNKQSSLTVGLFRGRSFQKMHLWASFSSYNEIFYVANESYNLHFSWWWFIMLRSTYGCIEAHVTDFRLCIDVPPRPYTSQLLWCLRLSRCFST